MSRHPPECIHRLSAAGIAWDDAFALRRIAMTLHRWYELECGDSNDYASRCITRGHKKNGAFEYDEDNGKPFIECHWYRGETKTQYFAIPDRENGAKKRLAKIMSKYPGFATYLQTDPRGAPLYVLTPYHMERYAGMPVDQIYNHGIAVYK